MSCTHLDCMQYLHNVCVYIYIFNYASTLSFTQAQGKKSTQTNNINNKTKTDRQHTYLIKQQKKMPQEQNVLMTIFPL